MYRRLWVGPVGPSSSKREAPGPSVYVGPAGTPIGTKVVLRFELDASGTATKVEYDDTANPELGASAVAAMRAASPFPAMDDSVRCLAGKRLKATFDAPAS